MPFEVNDFYNDPSNIERALEGSKASLEATGSLIEETHRASFSTPMEFGPGTNFVLSDGYEVAVPASKMADCLEGMAQILSRGDDIGLFNDITLRFVGRESALLSVSHDEPQMWIGFQDFVYYNQQSCADRTFLE